MFLIKFVFNDFPCKIRCFFYVQWVTSKVFDPRKTTPFLGVIPSQHALVFYLHTQTAGHDRFWQNSVWVCHWRTINLDTFISLESKSTWRSWKLYGVKKMTNTQNKLLKLVHDINEQSVNHSFFFLSLCLIPNNIATERNVWMWQSLVSWKPGVLVCDTLNCSTATAQFSTLLLTCYYTDIHFRAQCTFGLQNSP